MNSGVVSNYVKRNYRINLKNWLWIKWSVLRSTNLGTH